MQKSNQFTKKGSKLECDNYRPIVLLSHLDKIIEKLMFCTGHAVISVIEKIEKAIDNKMFVCGVFVDLHKAFDTVDQNILIHKLWNYEVRDIANCWFSSYLSNRKHL